MIPPWSDFMSYHEVGAHQVGMPARPFLPLSPEEGNEVVAILRDHLASALGAA